MTTQQQSKDFKNDSLEMLLHGLIYDLFNSWQKNKYFCVQIDLLIEETSENSMTN